MVPKAVRLEGKYTKSLLINIVKQGADRSPLLFNGALDEALNKVRAIGINIGININILGFVDNLVLVADSLGDFREISLIFFQEMGKQDKSE